MNEDIKTLFYLSIFSICAGILSFIYDKNTKPSSMWIFNFQIKVGKYVLLITGIILLIYVIVLEIRKMFH